MSRMPVVGLILVPCRGGDWEANAVDVSKSYQVGAPVEEGRNGMHKQQDQS